jgi:hypothetical protein
MYRRHALAVALAFTSAAVVAPAAAADPVGEPVWATVQTTFDAQADVFTSSIPGCETGLVTTSDDARAHFTPWGGVFIGTKSFECSGEGDLGFSLRLKARFGGSGSTGTWTLVDAWGDFAGARASGTLVGVPFADPSLGITDMYTGVVR